MSIPHSYLQRRNTSICNIQILEAPWTPECVGMFSQSNLFSSIVSWLAQTWKMKKIISFREFSWRVAQQPIRRGSCCWPQKTKRHGLEQGEKRWTKAPSNTVGQKKNLPHWRNKSRLYHPHIRETVHLTYLLVTTPFLPHHCIPQLLGCLLNCSNLLPLQLCLKIFLVKMKHLLVCLWFSLTMTEHT